MSDIFVSYSRKDIAFARILVQAMADRGLDAWIDWDDIPPSADWLAEVYQAIESADGFVFIISRASEQSEVCGKEIAHALANHKRLIPVVLDEIDPQNLPPAVASLNWIFFHEPGDYAASFERLAQAAQTDLPWTKVHTRLQVRALEWERKGHDGSYLLRGKDLHDAEAWLAQADSAREPVLTPIQTQYLLASRQQSARQQRLILAAVSGALVLTALLAVLAWAHRTAAVASDRSRATAQAQAVQAGATAIAESLGRAPAQANAERAGATAVAESDVRATAQANAETQRTQAVEQRTLALARQLGSQSELLRGQDPSLFQRSVLLAVESLKHAQTLEGDRALRAGLAILPDLKAHLRVRPHNVNGDYWDIDGLAISSDGRWLAAGSLGSVLTIWDTGTWEERRILTGSPVRTLAFSPDSQLLAGGIDSGAVIWEVATGQSLGTFGRGQVFSLAFTPDSERVAATADGKTSVWDRATRQTAYEVRGGGTLVRFSRDGQLAASAYITNTVVWETVSGKVLVDKKHAFRSRFVQELGLDLDALAFSPDGQRIAVGEGTSPFVTIYPRIPAAGEVSIFEARTGKDLAAIPAADAIVGLEFSPDGKQLAGGCSDGNLYLWDSSTGVQLRAIPAGSNVVKLLLLPTGQLAYINAAGAARVLATRDGSEVARLSTETRAGLVSLAAAPVAGLFAVGDAQGNVWLWHLAGQETMRAGVGEGVDISAVDFTPDGRQLLVADWNKTARIVDTATGRATESISHTQRLLVARLSPDGRWAASGTQDGKVKVWETSSGRLLFEARVGDILGDLQFSPDGHTLAASTGFWPREAWFVYPRGSNADKGPVIIWEVPSGKELANWPQDHLVNGLAFSPDGQRLAAAGEDHLARVVNVATGRELFAVGHQNRVNLVAFSVDGRLGASAEACFPVDPMTGKPCSPVVKVWEAATGRVIWRATMAAPWISNLLFSPDSRWLAAANSYIQGCPQQSCDFVVQVWDATTGRAAGRMVHSEVISALAFSPDSQTIASGGSDQTLRLWDPATGLERAHISGIGSPWATSFSADGRWLAEGGYEVGESNARVLPVQTGDLVQMACSRLSRNLTPQEWQQYLGDEPYRATCPELEGAANDTGRPNGPATAPRISPDGAYVIYESQATNLVCGTPGTAGALSAVGAPRQVYFYDRATRRNTLISVGPSGQPADADAAVVRVSADWSQALWSSTAGNLGATVDLDAAPQNRLYLWERASGSRQPLTAQAGGKDAIGIIAQWAVASSDLRYIAFNTNSDGPQPVRTPPPTDARPASYQQVYLLDRSTGRVRLVSATPAGQPGANASQFPKIASDGRYVAFESTAPDLLTEAAPGKQDNLYLYDQMTGKLALITRTRSGQAPDSDNHSLDRISEDDRWLTFFSTAGNLDVAPGATTSSYHLYDIVTGQITNTHAFALLPPENFDAARRTAVWYADWDDETKWYSGTGSQVFLRDETTGAKTLVSHNAQGEPGNDFSQDPAITADGQTVIFASVASDLVAGDTNTYADLFAWDRSTGKMTRLSVGHDGRQANGDSTNPAISRDGRYIVFLSDARNLLALDQSEGKQVYLLDRASGVIERVSEAAACPNR